MTKQQALPFWEEEHSRHFIDLGRIYTPRRDELQQAFIDLIPAWHDDDFTVVELACGTGWLAAGMLECYHRSHVIALDGSETMRAEARKTLAPFERRASIQPFVLEEPGWRELLPEGLRAVVSSLAIHHLRGPAKQQLFADLLPKLAPGGGLIICDLVEPAGEWTRRHFGRAWANDVTLQSVEIAGDDSAYRSFMNERWNYYENTPKENEGDYPDTIADQLRWLSEAGYERVDVAWSRAGHTLFCGYRLD
ncbi:MAG: trans-aconitate 2-methyltransferase [Thermomicrobiales bacterium]